MWNTLRVHAGATRSSLALPQVPWSVGVLALVLTTSACAKKTSVSVAAVGRVGVGLAEHSMTAPRAGDLCVIEKALEAVAGQFQEPPTTTCAKERTEDELWRRSLRVLGAYGDDLEAIALGAKPERSGKLQAERTMIEDSQWIEVEGDSQQSVRAAAADLVEVMRSHEERESLENIVEEAAPHVKTLCEELDAHLATQTARAHSLLEKVETEYASARTARCTQLNGTSVCVARSSADSVAHANTVALLTNIETHHRETRDTLSGFCAAHDTLTSIAADGRFARDASYDRIVQSMGDAMPAEPATPSETTEAPE
jgi:phosphoheptose isomerase